MSSSSATSSNASDQKNDYSLYGLMLLPIPEKIAERWPPADTGCLVKRPNVRISVRNELEKGTSLDRFLCIVLGEYKSYLEMGASSNIPALEVMHGFAQLFGHGMMQHVELALWRFELLNRAQVSFLKKRWNMSVHPYKSSEGAQLLPALKELSEDFDMLLTLFEAGTSAPPLPGDLRAISNVPSDELLKRYRAVVQPVVPETAISPQLISCKMASEFYQQVLLKYMFFMQMPACPTIDAITGMKSSFVDGPMHCVAWTHMVLALWHMELVTRKMVEHLASSSFNLRDTGYRTAHREIIHPALEVLNTNFKNLWAAWQAGESTASDVPMPPALKEKQEEFAFLISPELILQDYDFYLAVVYRTLRDNSSPVTFRRGLRTLLFYAEMKSDAHNSCVIATRKDVDDQNQQSQYLNPFELLQGLYSGGPTRGNGYRSARMGVINIQFWQHALLVLWSWDCCTKADILRNCTEPRNPYLLNNGELFCKNLDKMELDFAELLQKFRVAEMQ
jgi:hypothetical protein